MKVGLFFCLAMLTASAFGQGILERYGAGGSISRRFGGTDPREQPTIVINGQRYRVQQAPPQRPLDEMEEERMDNERIHYEGLGYIRSGSGYIDPKTGSFYPLVP